jgi:hypothetical protein
MHKYIYANTSHDMSSRHEVRMSKNHLHRSTSIYIDLPKSSRNDPGIVPEWSQCLDRCYGAGYLCNSWLLTLRSTSKNQELRYTMIHRFDPIGSCDILWDLAAFGFTRIKYSRLLSSQRWPEITVRRRHWRRRLITFWVRVDAILGHESLCGAFFEVPEVSRAVLIPGYIYIS